MDNWIGYLVIGIVVVIPTASIFAWAWTRSSKYGDGGGSAGRVKELQSRLNSIDERLERIEDTLNKVG